MSNGNKTQKAGIFGSIAEAGIFGSIAEAANQAVTLTISGIYCSVTLEKRSIFIW